MKTSNQPNGALKKIMPAHAEAAVPPSILPFEACYRQNKYNQQVCTASDMQHSIIKYERATYLSISVTQLDFTPQQAWEQTMLVAPLIVLTGGKLASQVKHCPALRCICPINLALESDVLHSMAQVSTPIIRHACMHHENFEMVIHTILFKLYHYFAECK